MIVFDIETSGLNPMIDRITSIAMLKDNAMICVAEESEKNILECFWEHFDSSLLVNFCGDTFDIPFLIKRSLINNIKMKEIKETIDLRKIVNGFYYSYDKYAKGNLRQWAEVLGIKLNTEDGQKMIQHYLNGDWEEIKKHNIEDVEITKALYDRCKDCGLLK